MFLPHFQIRDLNSESVLNDEAEVQPLRAQSLFSNIETVVGS